MIKVKWRTSDSHVWQVITKPFKNYWQAWNFIQSMNGWRDPNNVQIQVIK